MLMRLGNNDSQNVKKRPKNLGIFEAAAVGTNNTGLQDFTFFSF